MPLYRVIQHGDSKPRLVKAGTPAAAFRHVARPMFDVAVITDPCEAAELVEHGVRMETAGEEPEPPLALHFIGQNGPGDGRNANTEHELSV